MVGFCSVFRGGEFVGVGVGVEMFCVWEFVGFFGSLCFGVRCCICCCCVELVRERGCIVFVVVFNLFWRSFCFWRGFVSVVCGLFFLMRRWGCDDGRF